MQTFSVSLQKHILSCLAGHYICYEITVLEQCELDNAVKFLYILLQSF